MALAHMPTLVAEIAFTANPGSSILHFNDADRGKFNTGTFGGSNDFVDVTEWVRSGSISRGVSRHDGPIARSEAGKCSLVLDNRDRRFDPTNASGPYVSAGATQVVPMRTFRVRATWSGTTYDLWRGFADGWKLSYPNKLKDAITVLTGTDGTKVLANFDGAGGSSVGSGERTDQRISRILDNAAWGATDRDLDVGKTSVQATTLAQNSWSEILLTSDTEIGEVLFDETGKISFRHRHAIITDTRSASSQATFGDGAGELKISEAELEHDDTQIVNVVRIARTGGTVQTAEDSGSKSKYLKRTFERSDLTHQTDAESFDYANYILALHKDGDLRIASITIEPQRDTANLYPQALGRKIGDRITVKLTPPGGGSRISREVFIRGISHQFTPSRWTTTFALQDATKFGQFIFNSATNGVFNTNWIGY